SILLASLPAAVRLPVERLPAPVNLRVAVRRPDPDLLADAAENHTAASREAGFGSQFHEWQCHNNQPVGSLLDPTGVSYFVAPQSQPDAEAWNNPLQYSSN